MIEEWRDVIGYEGLYQVSNLGQVKSISDKKLRKRPERILAGSVSNRGYRRVTLFRGSEPFSQTVHRLVALAFLPNPNGKPQINHINGIKTDNRTDNLEWATHSENGLHSYKYLGRKAVNGATVKK